MHLIEVDFLNDRRPRQVPGAPQTPAGFSPLAQVVSPSLLPLVSERRVQVGLGLTGLGLLLVMGLLGQSIYLQFRKASLEKQLGVLRPQVSQALAWKEAADRASRETRELNLVFTRAEDWNSLLADLAQRTPDSIQLTEVREEKGVLTIQGRASRYPAVVTLLQNLRRARYLDPNARLAIDSARKVLIDYRPPGSPPDLPAVQAEYVDFSLSGRLRTPFPVTPRS